MHREKSIHDRSLVVEARIWTIYGAFHELSWKMIIIKQFNRSIANGVRLICEEEKQSNNELFI